MKIAFIIPPAADPKVRPAERTAGCTRVVYPAPNIYELTTAAFLEQQGHTVSYHDFIYPRRSTADLDRFLAADDSDAYAIWSVNLGIDDDLSAIARIAARRPEAHILMMGPAPTYFTRKLADASPRVVIARGEPELTVAEWAGKAALGPEGWADIAGLSYTGVDGRLHNNPSRPLNKNLDALPFPARHLLAGRHYHNPKLKTGPYTTAVTSRNCPYHCIYCVPSSLTFAREIDYRANHPGRKPTIGFRSTANVEAEVAELHRLGYRAIGFMDDNFIWDEKRTLELCRILKKYGMLWGCQARVDAITPTIARALADSGCRYVDFGIESFDPEILRYIKKGITPEQIESAIAMMHEAGVPVKLNVLLGSSPLETLDTIRHTFRRTQALGVDQVMFNIVSPFPGTEFYEIALSNGWIKGGKYRPTDVQRESILNYPHLSARQIEQALRRNNLRYFLHPRFIFRQIRRFTSWTEFTAAAKALKIKLFG